MGWMGGFTVSTNVDALFFFSRLLLETGTKRLRLRAHNDDALRQNHKTNTMVHLFPPLAHTHTEETFVRLETLAKGRRIEEAETERQRDGKNSKR